MINDKKANSENILCLTFLAITFFYFFESVQMSYFNVMAPYFLNHNVYDQHQIASLSAAYYYGDMAGLIPVGLLVDRFSLRKVLLGTIILSVIGSFLLMVSQNFYNAWSARFLCGFFGGTGSFLGGIRVLASLFFHRFTFFMGLFLSAGMMAGFICQYPLLIIVNHVGTQGAMMTMAWLGLIVGIINIIYLKPFPQKKCADKKGNYDNKYIKILIDISKNYRNWLDCLMVVFLDIPVSVIGTLWGIVLMMKFYHFNDVLSACIMMSLFAGLTIGSPIWGAVADHYHHSRFIIVIGGVASFFIVLLMLMFQNMSALWVGLLFFGLGFFSSCQTLGFTWLIKNMHPELIGLNSAINSMVFMGTNGLLKQVAAYLLVIPPFFKNTSSSGNLLVFTAIAMLLSAIYAGVRR